MEILGYRTSRGVGGGSVCSARSAKRFQDTRGTRRTTDIQNILSAVHTYVNDSQREPSPAATLRQKQIGTATTGCAISGAGGVQCYRRNRLH